MGGRVALPLIALRPLTCRSADLYVVVSTTLPCSPYHLLFPYHNPTFSPFPLFSSFRVGLSTLLLGLTTTTLFGFYAVSSSSSTPGRVISPPVSHVPMTRSLSCFRSAYTVVDVAVIIPAVDCTDIIIRANKQPQPCLLVHVHINIYGMGCLFVVSHNEAALPWHEQQRQQRADSTAM